MEHIPEAFVESTTIPPFFIFFMAAGAAVTFYLIFATDWIPIKFNMKDPRERNLALVLLALSFVILGWLLYLQLFQGGTARSWFPWDS